MSSMGVPLEWSVVEARCRSHRLDLCGVVAVPVAARSEEEVERRDEVEAVEENCPRSPLRDRDRLMFFSPPPSLPAGASSSSELS